MLIFIGIALFISTASLRFPKIQFLNVEDSDLLVVYMSI